MPSLLRFAGRLTGLAVCFAILATSNILAQASEPALKSVPAQQQLLPSNFAGWTENGATQTGTSPAVIDSANADVLSEYGLKDFSEASYRHGSDQVHIRAMRFQDATGAYGAYTFYRQPDMTSEKIGQGGAADVRQVVFWSGVTLVQVSFASPVADEQSALKVLTSKLPPALGSDAVPPTLPQYLPAASLNRSTVRYMIGPVAYARSGGVLPSNVIDFSQDAEVVTAQYSTHEGRGTLTLIGYPTPQMAVRAEKQITTLLNGQLPASLQQSTAASLAVHRSGPIVAVTSGNFSSAEAQAILGQVKYQAEVTLNRNIDFTREVKNAGKMLLGIAYLTGIIIVCAIVFGILLGGGRAVWRVMRGKPISTVYEEDFISLNLGESSSQHRQNLP